MKKTIALLGIAFAIAGAQTGDPFEFSVGRVKMQKKGANTIDSATAAAMMEEIKRQEERYKPSNQEDGTSTNECRWLTFSRVDIGCTFANSDLEYMYSVAGLAQITGQFNPRTGKVYDYKIRTDVAEAKAKECCIKNRKKNDDYDVNCKEGVMDRFSQQLKPHIEYVANMDIYNSICVKELGSYSDEGANDPRYQRFRKGR